MVFKYFTSKKPCLLYYYIKCQVISAFYLMPSQPPYVIGPPTCTVVQQYYGIYFDMSPTQTIAI